MTGIDARIEIWKERLKSGNEDIREGAGLSMLMQLQSGGWRKTSYPGEYSLALPEGYGELKAILSGAVEKGTLKSEPVVEWVAQQKAAEEQVRKAFDDAMKADVKVTPAKRKTKGFSRP